MWLPPWPHRFRFIFCRGALQASAAEPHTLCCNVHTPHSLDGGNRRAFEEPGDLVYTSSQREGRTYTLSAAVQAPSKAFGGSGARGRLGCTAGCALLSGCSHPALSLARFGLGGGSEAIEAPLRAQGRAPRPRRSMAHVEGWRAQPPLGPSSGATARPRRRPGPGQRLQHAARRGAPPTVRVP